MEIEYLPQSCCYRITTPKGEVLFVWGIPRGANVLLFSSENEAVQEEIKFLESAIQRDKRNKLGGYSIPKQQEVARLKARLDMLSPKK